MARESAAGRKQRAARIIAILKRTYPDARCALDHGTPLELLVSTILSAQCTDELVNKVTPGLFAKYPSAKDYAGAAQDQLEKDIARIGLFRNKAKNIRATAAALVERHGGEVPRTMDELVELPGVARKTANVVLGNAYGLNEGIVADTHVQRIAQRLRLTTYPDNYADRIEKDLTAVVDRREWTLFGHLLIFHGRRCCTARGPDCAGCAIRELCPSAGKPDSAPARKKAQALKKARKRSAKEAG